MSPELAVVTCDVGGGGVATVARLLRDVFRDEWPNDGRVVELVPHWNPERSHRLSLASCLRFGAGLAVDQIARRPPWILYGHLSVARVQAFVPRPVRRPYAVFLHGIEAWRPLSHGRLGILAGASLRVANSHHTAERVRRAHPEVGAIRVCPLALERSARVRSASGESVNDPDLGPSGVLLVGRMLASERYKGHDQLLEAWPLVMKAVPAARLVFAGTGDDVERLRGKARDLGLGRCVTFAGFVDDDRLDALYRHAAVFAMPSREEGFGLVYLEAMARGVPCVGSTHDAAREVIEDGVTGFLVDQADTGALADRIVRLLTDAPRRVAMGQRAAARVTERFGFARFRTQLLEHLGQAFGTCHDTGRRVIAADTHVA